MAFRQIDQTAADADRPLTTALVQDIRGNMEAARSSRLRRCSTAYDARDTPQMCGTYAWRGNGTRVFVGIPFLWVLTHAATMLKATIRHEAIDGDCELGFLAIPLDRITSRLPQNEGESNHFEHATALVASGLTDTTFEIPAPRSSSGEVLCFVVARSTVVGSEAELLNGSGDPVLGDWGAYSIALTDAITGTYATDQRACLKAEIQDITKSKDWTNDPDLPAPRQVLRHVPHADYRDIDVWPPFGGHSSEVGRPTNTDSLYYTTLSSIDLYSVTIEETAVAPLPDLYGALNAGRPTGVANVGRLSHELDTVALQHTRVHTIGSAVRNATYDATLGTLELTDRVATWQEYSESWQELIACPVGDPRAFVSLEGAAVTHTSYSVVALIALSYFSNSAPSNPLGTNLGRGESFNLDLQLQLSDPDGTTLTTGNTESFVVPGNTMSGVRGAVDAASDPVGALLALRGLGGHALRGMYPIDIFHTGRYLVYRSRIRDDETTEQRRLALRFKGDFSPLGQMDVHLLAWNVISTPSTTLSVDALVV